MTRQTILIDFDGVVHTYGAGWQGGRIYDAIMPGFIDWAMMAADTFDLCIYSSRSAQPEGIAAMQRWMHAQVLQVTQDPERATAFVRLFQWPTHKPPAWVTIDDRCVPFLGSWYHPSLDPRRLAAFRPWNKDGGNLQPSFIDDLHNAEKENDHLRKALRWAMARLKTLDQQELQELIEQRAVPDSTDDALESHTRTVELAQEVDDLIKPFVEQREAIPDSVALKLEPLLSQLRGIEGPNHRQPPLFPRQARRAAHGG